MTFDIGSIRKCLYQLAYYHKEIKQGLRTWLGKSAVAAKRSNDIYYLATIGMTTYKWFLTCMDTNMTLLTQ
jgi:carbonic anhydrase